MFPVLVSFPELGLGTRTGSTVRYIGTHDLWIWKYASILLSQQWMLKRVVHLVWSSAVIWLREVPHPQLECWKSWNE